MKVKFKKIDIIIILLYVAIFKIYAIPQTLQQGSKILFLILVLLFLVTHIKFRKLFNLSLLLAVTFSFSGVLSWIRGRYAMDRLLESILYGICIYCIYTVIQYCHENNYINRLHDDVYYLTCIYCVISVCSILSVGTSKSGTEMTYFFGNKFSTCYLFLMFVALYFVKYKDKMDAWMKYKTLYFIFCVLVLCICVWVHCSTALFGGFTLFFPLLPKKVQQITTKPIVVLGMIGIAGTIIFGINVVLSNVHIQYFISEVLGKSMSLTGRIYIYINLREIIQESLFWGYGYNSGIVSFIVGYGNAQNGLMEILINYGMVGLGEFLFAIYFCVKQTQKLTKYYGFYVFIYAMIACSVVEISYNFYFFLALFMIRWAHDELQVV